MNKHKLAFFVTILLISLSGTTYYIYQSILAPKIYNMWEVKCSGLCYEIESGKPISGTVIKYDTMGRTSVETVFVNGKEANTKTYFYRNIRGVEDIVRKEYVYDVETGNMIRASEYEGETLVNDCKYHTNGTKFCLNKNGQYESDATISIKYVTH